MDIQQFGKPCGVIVFGRLATVPEHAAGAPPEIIRQYIEQQDSPSI